MIVPNCQILGATEQGSTRLPLQESTSKDELKTQCKDADLSAEKLFKADEEIDGPGIPSVDEYLQSSGLQQFF